ncbi:MAG: sterol desaturase family protein [Myxococcota bacterium]
MESLIAAIEDNLLTFVAFVFVFSLGLMVVEFLWEWRKGKLTREYFKEIGVSLSVQIPSSITEALLAGTVVAIYGATYDSLPFHVPIAWWSTLLLLVFVDFIHYWTHRWEHEVRGLWTHHSVHHSSPIYNYSTAFRVVFTRQFFDIAYYFVLVLLGFHPILIFACLQIIAVYQFWLHTQLIRRLGPLESILMTPSHHRVHHGSQPEYLDKNYGALTVLWDKLFGTFAPERAPVKFGLTTPIGTTNPLEVHFYEYARLLRDLSRAGRWRDRWNYVARPPGWRPPRGNTGTGS